MKSNYDINKEKILEDYFLCLGSFKNCSNLYKNKDYFILKETDTEEQRNINKGMQSDLLSNLGKVGEKAFKYIIGLENLKTYPNQDSKNFEQLWKKKGTLEDFATKHKVDIKSSEFLDLLNYYDENGQRAHNFAYWFTVMNLIMKDISEKFKNFIQYSIQSNYLINYCKKNNLYKVSSISKHEQKELSIPFRAAIFPYLIHLYEIKSLPDKKIRAIEEAKNKAIEKHGDIYTRLRYASNNPDNKTFNVDEVYELINNIITFIEMIHLNNDDLNFDLNKSFAKNKSLEYKEQLELSEDEINNLFNLDLTGNELALTIYEENYPYKQIKKLLEVGVPKSDIRKVMRENLKGNSIKFFYNNGITDYKKMKLLIEYYIKYGDYPISYPKLRKTKQ